MGNGGCKHLVEHLILASVLHTVPVGHVIDLEHLAVGVPERSDAELDVLELPRVVRVLGDL